MKMPIKASDALPWALKCEATRREEMKAYALKSAQKKRSFWSSNDIDCEMTGLCIRHDRAKAMVDRLKAAGNRDVILDNNEMTMLTPYMA